MRGEYIGHLMIDDVHIPVYVFDGDPFAAESSWMTATEAGTYIGSNRQRIADLMCEGKLKPDGYDGRSPRFRPETLDSYLTGVHTSITQVPRAS